jgi:HK97 family phage portal protein
VRNPFAALFDRKSANWPQDVIAYLRAGNASASGQVVNERSAFNVAAVLTGVSIRSGLLATLPVDVIEKLPDGRSTRDVPTHPVARVLRKPNSWQTRCELVGMVEAHRILRGNGYMWKNLVSGIAPGDGGDRLQVAELIPLHPDRLESTEPDEFGAPTLYKLHRKTGAPVPLPALEVVHLKALSTNGRVGRSLLQDLREVIGGALATQEHANSLWSRDATPTVALKHPKTLNDKGRENLEKSWEATYGQTKDKRRVAVLEEGMEIQQLSLSPEDGQFLQTQQDLREQLAAALRLPPFMMGLSAKQTSWGTGIEQQQIGIHVFTLGPDVVVWEQRLDLDLLTRPEKFGIKFRVNGTMRGDAASRSEFYWRMVQMGAMSPNDVRAFEDMNPTPDGDVYLQPTNLAPLGFDPTKPPTPAKPAAGDA